MTDLVLAKWGNSLAIRIPHVLADQLGLKENSPVKVNVEDGRFVISRGNTLADMLASLTDGGNDASMDWGSPVGREEWI